MQSCFLARLKQQLEVSNGSCCWTSLRRWYSMAWQFYFLLATDFHVCSLTHWLTFTAVYLSFASSTVVSSELKKHLSTVSKHICIMLGSGGIFEGDCRTAQGTVVQDYAAILSLFTWTWSNKRFIQFGLRILQYLIHIYLRAGCIEWNHSLLVASQDAGDANLH